MIVCMYRKVCMTRTKKPHNKVEACVAFALRHILQSCPQARSIFFFPFFYSVRKGKKKKLSKLLTRRIGTFGSEGLGLDRFGFE